MTEPTSSGSADSPAETATAANDANHPARDTLTTPSGTDGASAARTSGDQAAEAAPDAPTRRRLRPVLMAAAVAVLLAGAGLTYALTRPAEAGFGSPEAIASLLAERGAPCDDFSDDGGDGLANKRGVCSAEGRRIIIATFDSRSEVEAHWERQVKVAPENQTVGMVIGDKWSISGTALTYLRHAAEVLDAEFRNN